jgi:putative DNA methylase
VTDPPFFDNVHYSELADFCHAWRQLSSSPGAAASSTRKPSEVHGSDADRFAVKLQGVFRECRRILKDDGLLVFSDRHSREEGWKALAAAVLGAGFVVVNSQPVKAEMSVATPKSQAKEPIPLDIILVCRKESESGFRRPSVAETMESARSKLARLRAAQFNLSRTDQRIVIFGQLLTTFVTPTDAERIARHVDSAIDESARAEPIVKSHGQMRLFDQAFSWISRAAKSRPS